MTYLEPNFEDLAQKYFKVDMYKHELDVTNCKI